MGLLGPTQSSLQFYSHCVDFARPRSVILALHFAFLLLCGYCSRCRIYNYESVPRFHHSGLSIHSLLVVASDWRSTIYYLLLTTYWVQHIAYHALFYVLSTSLVLQCTATTASINAILNTIATSIAITDTIPSTTSNDMSSANYTPTLTPTRTPTYCSDPCSFSYLDYACDSYNDCDPHSVTTEQSVA